MTTTQREAVAVQPVSGIRVFRHAVGCRYALVRTVRRVPRRDVFIFLSKYFWHNDGYFRTARDFPWTVPLGHAVLLFLPGTFLVAAVRVCGRVVSSRWVHGGVDLRVAWRSWPLMQRPAALTRLASVPAGDRIGSTYRLDRMPVPARHPWCLAFIMGGSPGRAGQLLGGLLNGMAGRSRTPRRSRACRAAFVGRPKRHFDRVGYRPRLQRFVVRIFPRHHPQLDAVGKEGRPVQPRALAAAPWTYPSHTCFFTGQWPFQAQFPVEVPARVRRIRQLPSTSRHTAIKPPASRRTRVRRSYETGLEPGLRPLRRLFASPYVATHSHGSREMDALPKP